MRQSLIAVLACVALSVACDNSGDSSSTSPTPVVRTSDTFTWTVQPMTSDTHNFTVSQAGQVDVTLTAAGPPSTIFMGLGVGSPSATDGTCQFANGAGVGVNTQAASTPQIVGGTSSGGTFCVVVFDIGNQTGPVDYTVTVTHP
jgi:hypothetical protein